MRNNFKDTIKLIRKAKDRVLAEDITDDQMVELMVELIDKLMETLGDLCEENRQLRAELRGGSVQ